MVISNNGAMSDEVNENNATRQPHECQKKIPIIQHITRWILFYYVINNVMKLAQRSGILPKSPSQLLYTQEPETSLDRMSTQFADDFINTRHLLPMCIWKPYSLMNLHVYITDSSTFTYSEEQDTILGEWHVANILLGDTKGDNKYSNITISTTKGLQYNETHLYAHVQLVRLNDVGVDVGDTNKLAKSFPLTKHRVRTRIQDEKSLLSGKSNDGNDVIMDNSIKNVVESDNPLTLASNNKTHDQTLLYLKPSLTIQMIDINGPSLPARDKIPLKIGKHMDWLDEYSHKFFPILYNSEFWILKDKLVEVNDTMVDSSIEIRFEVVSIWKWQIMSQIEDTWEQQEQFGGDQDNASDVFRTLLLETNPYLLAVTGLVSILHMILDMLAFKNDIDFFKGNKSMEGLSLRTMVVNVMFQFVILLYLADNNTSFMVLASNGVGLVIEIWKIRKAIKVSLFDKNGRLSFKFETAKSYSSSKTKVYDEIATGHLLFVTMPLVTGYGMYSLLYQKHKGWYSWIINTLVGFIYMFGFVMMTPQLFINYKLQSVAHMNYKTMTYKSINTFIDDLFAFIIKMPVMHRLACLRDDVIFFIFCYQRYKYRTDFTRVNEYGQCVKPNENNSKMALEEVCNDETKSQKTCITSIITDTKKKRGAKDKRS